MSALFSKKTAHSENASVQTEPFGKLLRIRHESSGGSMSYRSEFEIEVTPQQIVCCAYWPEDCSLDMVRKSHVPVSAEQWEDVAQTVQTLWPLFREVKPKPPIPTTESIHVLDGGDYSRWYLTRETANGEYTAQYYQPDDRRIRTLTELLHELANPTGRDIPRYDPPVLCGIYYQNEKERCSYQCTPWGDGEDGYRFIVYDTCNKQSRSLYEHVPDSVWNEARMFAEPLYLDRFPSGSFQDKVSCTLYYSDGKQKRVVPDKAACATLLTGFTALAERVQHANGEKGDS